VLEIIYRHLDLISNNIRKHWQRHQISRILMFPQIMDLSNFIGPFMSIFLGIMLE